jgi:hypothetical protein
VAAVTAYLQTCRAEIDVGNTVPFEPHLKRLEKMLADLEASSTLLSQYTPEKPRSDSR